MRLTALVVPLFFTIPAMAAVSGSTITVTHASIDESTVADGPYTYAIANGPADARQLAPLPDHDPRYRLDIDDSQLYILFLEETEFPATGFNGLIITNLTLPPFQLDATAGYSHFSYDNKTLKLGWTDLIIPNEAEYWLVFVPEPTSLMIFAVAAAIMVGRGGRKREPGGSGLLVGGRRV